MATVPIRCPGCGANSSSDPDAHGIHTCEFCTTRFKLAAGAQPVTVGPAPEASKGRGAAVALVGLVALLAVGGAVALSTSQVDPPTPQPDVLLDQPDPRPMPEVVSAEVVSQEVEAPVEPSATFEHHATLQSSKGTFYVLGELTNTSPFPLGQTKINIVLYDAAGKELMVDTGFTVRDVIPAGGTSPVSAIVSDAPDYDHLGFEVIATKPFYLPKQVEGLHVEPAGLTKDRTFWTAQGKVRNDGDTPAKFVQIEIVGRNAAGKVVGVQTTYADGDVLKPGGAARYNYGMVRFTEDPATVDYVVTGRPAD